MAAPTTDVSNDMKDANGANEPRKFKASELPLPSATRAAIESLAFAFKKEGAYDTIRKQVWDKFKASVRSLSCQLISSARLICNRTTKSR